MILLDTRIDGRAVPMPRPRLGRYGNVYSNSKRVKSWKKIVSDTAAIFRKVRQPSEKICAFEVVFWFENVPKTGCDWDNLGKAVCDACNGILWVDDTQVWRAVVDKRQSQHGDYVDIKAWELP